MGFGNKHSIVDKDYLEWCEYFDLYNGEELSHEHEDQLCVTNWQGRVCMIKNFPNYTSPFWNMRQNGDGTAAKIDVIISGQETIGSAERADDPQGNERSVSCLYPTGCMPTYCLKSLDMRE